MSEIKVTCLYCGKKHHPGICCPAYAEISKSPYVKRLTERIEELGKSTKRLEQIIGEQRETIEALLSDK